MTLAALQIGNAAPGAAAPDLPAGAKAAFDPAAVTLVAVQNFPKGAWDASETVHVHTTGDADTRKKLKLASARLSSDDGHQVTVAVNDPEGDKDVTVQVEVEDIRHAGEYDGMLRLDPLDADSPTLAVTVKARHIWVWPLLLVIVSALGYSVGSSWLGAYSKAKATSKQTRNGRRPTGWLSEWANSWKSAKGGVYLAALLLSGVAFLLPVYTATNFGSFTQYAAVVLAGILGKAVADTFPAPGEDDDQAGAESVRASAQPGDAAAARKDSGPE